MESDVPDFIVPIVLREKLDLWHKRSPLSGTPAGRAIKADRDGSLGQTVRVRAKNAAEAARLAEEENRCYVAIRDAISKL